MKRSVTSWPLAVTVTVTAVWVGVQGRTRGWEEGRRRKGQLVREEGEEDEGAYPDLEP